MKKLAIILGAVLGVAVAGWAFISVENS